MVENISTLGSDEQSGRKIDEIILLFMGVIVFGFLYFNTTLASQALGYWVFGMMGLGGVVLAFIINKKNAGPDDVNVPISEKPLFGNRKMILILTLLVGVITFFVLAQSEYRVSAASFQLIDLGLQGNILYTVFAALFEDSVFFIVIPGFTFYFVKRKTGNPMLAFLVALFLSPAAFLVYHTARYGPSDVVKSTAVFVFGMEMAAWMLIFRNTIYVHVRHITNNTSILIFDTMFNNEPLRLGNYSRNNNLYSY